MVLEHELDAATALDVWKYGEERVERLCSNFKRLNSKFIDLASIWLGSPSSRRIPSSCARWSQWVIPHRSTPNRADLPRSTCFSPNDPTGCCSQQQRLKFLHTNSKPHGSRYRWMMRQPGCPSWSLWVFFRQFMLEHIFIPKVGLFRVSDIALWWIHHKG